MIIRRSCLLPTPMRSLVNNFYYLSLRLSLNKHTFLWVSFGLLLTRYEWTFMSLRGLNQKDTIFGFGCLFRRGIYKQASDFTRWCRKKPYDLSLESWGLGHVPLISSFFCFFVQSNHWGFRVIIPTVERQWQQKENIQWNYCGNGFETNKSQFPGTPYVECLLSPDL